MNDNGCWWMPVGSQFCQPQYLRQASSKTSGSSEIHPPTQWSAIYYREQLLSNTNNVCTRTVKATVCMMDSATCKWVYVALITLKQCTPLLQYYDSKVTINSDGCNLWTTSFQLHKQAKQLQNLFNTSLCSIAIYKRATNIKSWHSKEKLESRGLQMLLLSLSRAETEKLFIVATETLQLSDQNTRTKQLICDRNDLPTRLTWDIRTSNAMKSPKADVGLASFSLTLLVFPNSTLHLLWFFGQYSKTLWCSGSMSNSSSDGCVFKSHQCCSFLEQVFSLPMWWNIVLN